MTMIALVSMFLLLGCAVHASETATINENRMEPNTVTTVSSYNRESRISDVMANPAFGTYGRLIFPVNTSYWRGTTLEQLNLTWYTHINADKTVEVVNYLLAHSNDCFYDIYTEAEKQADPRKRDT